MLGRDLVAKLQVKV